MSELEDTLQGELADIDDGEVVLIETEAERAMEISVSLVKVLTQKDLHGIILSASRPCDSILNSYKKNGVDLDKIFILDTVCKMQTQTPPEHDNVLHLESASALTNASIAINEAINDIGGEKFLFFDSLSSMLIHNKPDVLARFVHSVLTRIRIAGVSGIILTLEEETDKQIRAEVLQLCDKIIKV